MDKNHSRITSCKAFTIVEVLIVVVLIAILAGIIIPLYLGDLDGQKAAVARHNLHLLRAYLEVYAVHHGEHPPTLTHLVSQTNQEGKVGSGAEYHYGPYVAKIPRNPLTSMSNVTLITNSPASRSDAAGDSGWLYNPATGEVWIDHAEFFSN